MIIYDNDEVKVEVSDYSARIAMIGSKSIYITLKELADVGEAIAVYLKRETELEYEAFAWSPAGEV